MTKTQNPTEIKLPPSQLDLSSVRAQMVIGLILIAVSCVVCYWKACKVGFLLDDFYHVDYVSRAFHGQWHDFFKEFYSNWTGTDILTCYRPAISVSYFIDYFLWGANAIGYHISNILMFIGCCVFVSLITLEMTGKYGNRLGALPAIWAGLLFSVYPLHPEAVTWIIGRVDVQCGLFYLASVFTFLRFRLLRENAYLWVSIVCFLIALPSKEMAVTLPVVLTLVEGILFFGKDRLDLPWKERIKYIGIFWLLLAAYAIFRTLLLGTMVGGYGGSGLFAILKLWRVFIDKSSLLKLVFPFNEEVTQPFSQFKILGIAYVLVAGSFLFRLISRSVYWRPFLFLLLWIIVAVLPTFQIWHIHPNLVGSRLFFLSSAPFCMLIALMALPAVDALGKQKAKITTALGVAGLIILFVAWSFILRANLSPWEEAGAQMNKLKSQLWLIAAKTPEGKRTLFLNLPQDHSGAGMLGRPQFLETLSRYPFASGDLSNRLLTIEPQLAGSHDFMWPHQFANLLNDSQVHDAYIWQSKSGEFLKWGASSSPEVQKTYSILFGDKNIADLVCDTHTIALARSSDWYKAELGGPQVIVFPDHLYVVAGSTGLTIYFPSTNLDPLSAGFAKLILDSNQSEDGLGGKIQLVWNSSDSDEPKLATFSSSMTLPLNRYRNWELRGPVKKLGLRFLPGSYTADVKALEISSDSAVLPEMSISNNVVDKDPYKLWLLKIGSEDNCTLSYDVTRIPNATAVDVLVTKAGVTFDPSSEADTTSPYPPGEIDGRKLLSTLRAAGTSGKISLPMDLLKSPGLHQIRIIAKDKSGASIGLPGEPQSLLVH